MPGPQRILVVSTTADDAELVRVRGGLGRDPVVVTAPTPDAVRVVRVLEVDPRPELLLAPVSFPDVDRGHRLDVLVRRHALADRFRDVVVVADPATTTLLLRELAPAQLASGGGVTTVGLPRGDRPVELWRAVGAGVGLGVVASITEPQVPLLVLPGAAGLAGAGLMLVPRWRHVGRELLIAAAVAALVVFLVIAGSARFPDGW